MEESARLSAVDYVVFVALLAASLLIGLVHAIYSKRKSARDLLVASKGELGVFSIGLSISASYLSAVTILGTPSEVYTYGVEYWQGMLGIPIAAICASYLFMPIFYPLKITSIYEYLELRYRGKAVRVMGCVSFMITETLSLGIATYAPALAISAVTGMPEYASILLSFAVCILYTSIRQLRPEMVDDFGALSPGLEPLQPNPFTSHPCHNPSRDAKRTHDDLPPNRCSPPHVLQGGLRTVVWTDVLQSVFMFVGLLCVIIIGADHAGGMSRVWGKAEESGRINFLDFGADPFQRQNVWSLVSNFVILWTAALGCRQASLQRHWSSPTLSRARMAVYLSLPGTLLIISCACLAGLVVYGNYADCDPKTNGDIEKIDEIVPYFILQHMGDLKGLPGLFVASLFGGALSTMSSILNSIPAVTMEDIVLQIWKGKQFSERQRKLLVRLLSVGFGGLGVGVALGVAQLQGILQVCLSLIGIMNGPILGLFVASIFLPFVNTLGACLGTITGTVMSAWIGMGGWILEVTATSSALAFSTEGCELLNRSSHAFYGSASDVSLAPRRLRTPDLLRRPAEGYEQVYTISYLLLPHIGLGITLLVSIVVSLLSGGHKEIGDIDEKLVNGTVLRLFSGCRKSNKDPMSSSEKGVDLERF
ncbi:unnamed protein product [Darwinula stevensoni]|uniref:Sodium-coupled monocarboxylate transporter 1 n=1 Tax=Darwinula stevensoni TaxID=69355 RepID=A0A7R9A699_9CRUS|nr:unnamed protein product [Darwinula stevensoni]CAG0887133.1 unnamed protein product [Darwinula stevensoni]